MPAYLFLQPTHCQTRVHYIVWVGLSPPSAPAR